MKTFQKIILLVIIIVTTGSCNDIKNHKKKNLKNEVRSNKENTVVIKEENSYNNINYLSDIVKIYNDSLLDTSVLKKIKSYYYEEYEKQWREMLVENETTIKLPVSTSESDTISYLGFSYQEDESENPVVVGMIHCSIPKKQGINLYMSSPILYTDLNRDGEDDLVVVVHTEGGWVGANIYNQDIFVFLKKNNTYHFSSITPDWEMIIPDRHGYIRVKNVEKGVLIAEGSVYSKRDARCCPSDMYLMKYTYEGNKFEILSSEFLGVNPY